MPETPAKIEAHIKHLLSQQDPEGVLAPYLTYKMHALFFWDDARASSHMQQYPEAFPQPRLPIRRIAIDPGHLGGPFAEREHRLFVKKRGWFKEPKELREGDLNAIVAELLADAAKHLGLDVLLTRTGPEPVFKGKQDDFDVFYRTELLRRCEIINDFKPDLTLLIHFNATDLAPFVGADGPNGPMAFVFGYPLRSEAMHWEKREEIFAKVMDNSFAMSKAVAGLCVQQLAASFGLPALSPPYAHFTPETAAKFKEIAPGVCLRNLLQLRKIQGPAVLVEGTFMNNSTEFEKLCDNDTLKGIKTVPHRCVQYAEALTTVLTALSKTTNPIL